MKTLKNTFSILLIAFISMNINAQVNNTNSKSVDTASQAPKNQQTGCVSGDCENGFGKYVIMNSRSFYQYYEGNFKNGKWDGQGTRVEYIYHRDDKKFAEVLRYEGNFKNRKYHGKGKETATLSEYDGNWKEGQKNGYGIFTLVGDMSIYKGNWLNDMKDGEGKEVFSSGSSFEGEFKQDEFYKGTYISKSGQKYIGEFYNKKRDGQGKYYLESGELYFEGRFKNGDPIRNVVKGTKELNDGIYNGELIDGLADGFGKLEMNDGTYIGSFRDDKMHGKGTFTAPNGMKYIGEFKNDAMNGQGEFTFADGGKIIGEFKDGKKHGYCTEYDKSGKIVDEGNFVNGRKFEF